MLIDTSVLFNAFHSTVSALKLVKAGYNTNSDRTKIRYSFYNHFHPFVGQMLEQLNKKSIDGFLDINFQLSLAWDGFDTFYKLNPDNDSTVEADPPGKGLDISHNGPYGIYNWELFFHAPVLIAVHLSQNQRFAEAQKWFHYVFNPTSTDTSVEPPARFWNFIGFRQHADNVEMINDMLTVLGESDDTRLTSDQLIFKQETIDSIAAWRNKPFQPHIIANTRFQAYQVNVVMKYLDNLVAWGDSLFKRNTMETINEATQVYVLASNILGERPQLIPARTKPKPMTFAMMRDRIDAFGNVLEEMEVMFPFNTGIPRMEGNEITAGKPLLGMSRSLYFCIPVNDKLLEYWDIVEDRLFKIRHCMNIAGVVQQLPLYDPPIDPGMMVKALAAGMDLSSLLNSMNQPGSLVRSPLLLQKAVEMSSEVRNLGSALLSSLEKKDAEDLALLRQSHEIKILNLMQDVKYLQWKDAEANTEALMRSRETALSRYGHYQMLLGKAISNMDAVRNVKLERKPITEQNFEEVFNDLVSPFNRMPTLEDYPREQLDFLDQLADTVAGALGLDSSPTLHLNKKENLELNVFLPGAHYLQQAASMGDTIAMGLKLIPQFQVDAKPLGVGAGFGFGGVQLSGMTEIGARLVRMLADELSYMAARASKTSAYNRRTEDWILQCNAAANELVQIGKQVVASLIREQTAKKEYDNHKAQITNSIEVDTFIKEQKFTTSELQGWMQGELFGLYNDCYNFASNIALRAEATMKTELMLPEFTSVNYIKFNYWDGLRKGLLAGEKLYFDLKRLELAYYDYNKREYELTKHISLKQLDALALLKFKKEGKCEFEVPEWLLDMDCPGHYLRRIKTVSISVPCVAGPYTSINCTLTLLKSTIRISSNVSEGYSRKEGDSKRFKDYFSSIESIVTSTGQNDSGLFETNLRDERYLPFEGAGMCSSWRLEIPMEKPQFNHQTISDVIVHFRYTSRPGGDIMKTKSTEEVVAMIGNQDSPLLRMFNLPQDFPNEWHNFKNNDSAASIELLIKNDLFPYFTNGKNIKVQQVNIFDSAYKVKGSLPLAIELTDVQQEGKLSIPKENVGEIVIIKYMLS
ncbi:MAG: hypothetical protein ABI760_05405 [Ferruginibacter sp.]